MTTQPQIISMECVENYENVDFSDQNVVLQQSFSKDSDSSIGNNQDQTFLSERDDTLALDDCEITIEEAEETEACGLQSEDAVNKTIQKTKKTKYTSTDTKILEKIELRNKLSTRYACCYSDNGRLAIATDEGIYVLTLEYGMHRLNAFFTYKKKFFKHSDYVLTKEFGIDINNFMSDLPQFDFYEAVLRLDMTSNSLQNCPAVNVRPVLTKWSPAGLVRQNECALASLSNLGTIEIFVNIYDEYEVETYIMIANISKQCVNEFKTNWKDIECLSLADKYEELKLRSEQLTSSAFVWSHVFNCNDRNNCILFVGHLNGCISAWRYENKGVYTTEDQFSFVGYQKTSLKRITALGWGKTDSGGVLFMGDNEGKCNALLVKDIFNNTIKFPNEFVFWNEVDLIQVDYVDFLSYNNSSILSVIKNNILVTYLINENSVVVDSEIFQAGNIHITGIQHYEENKFLVTTWTGVIYLITTLICEDKINLEVKTVSVDISWTIYRCHGFFMSSNRVFFGFLTNPCRQRDLVRKNEFVTLFMVKNLHKNALQILMDPSVTSLENYWDCLELLRIRAAIEKEHPAKGLQQVNYDDLSLKNLKVLMFLARASETLFHRILLLTDFKYMLSYTQIRTIVDMKMAVGRIKKLLELYSTNTISKFQMQNLCLLNVYLKNMVLDGEILDCRLGNNAVNEIYEVMVLGNRITYPEMPRCEYCNDIISEKCIPTHYEMRCGISKMPVDSFVFYKCPYCFCNVCKEIEEEFTPICCPYCDVIMYKRDLSNKKIDERKTIKWGVSSECYEDCVKNIVDINDVDDEPVCSKSDFSDEECFVSEDSNSADEDTIAGKNQAAGLIIEVEHITDDVNEYCSETSEEHQIDADDE